ncbi:MAG: hypothetical protein HZA20_08845 [Nitrospirae bacterium]|nr:hypothetical protein [Nitrospirota bacterium]
MNAIALAASGRTTIALIIAAAGAYVHATFGNANPYDAWAAFMLSNPAGIAIYAAVILNLAAGIAAALRGSLHIAQPSAELIRNMDAYAEIDVAGIIWREQAGKWLTTHGFSIRAESEFSITGIKGRWSSLPGVLLRFGLITLLIGIAVSHHSRLVENAMLSPGESAALLGNGIQLVSIESGMPASHLQIGKERSFAIENASARIKFGVGEFIAGSGWPVGNSGIYWKINGLGFAPEIAFNAEGGMRPYRLELLPPGREDSIDINGASVKIALAPERVIRKGLLSGEVYNLAAPTLRLAAGLNTPAFKIEGRGMEPTIGKTGVWVRVQAVRDAGLGMVKAGLTIVCAGLLLLFCNLFWYKREMAFALDRDTLVFGYSEQYLKKWGVYRFERWKPDIFIRSEGASH